MARSYGPVATGRNRDQPRVQSMMPVPFLLQARQQVTRFLRLQPETVNASCSARFAIAELVFLQF